MSEMTPEQMREYVESAPLPGDGHSPYERTDLEKGITPGVETAYSMVARSLAHALLVLCEEDPSLLIVPSREDDETGFDAADNEKLWDAFKARWPKGDDWLGGCTGFQYGWAHNAVRYILDAPAVGNPAIITIGGRR